jgi:hypothetical protein
MVLRRSLQQAFADYGRQMKAAFPKENLAQRAVLLREHGRTLEQLKRVMRPVYPDFPGRHGDLAVLNLEREVLTELWCDLQAMRGKQGEMPGPCVALLCSVQQALATRLLAATPLPAGVLLEVANWVEYSTVVIKKQLLRRAVTHLRVFTGGAAKKAYLLDHLLAKDKEEEAVPATKESKQEDVLVQFEWLQLLQRVERWCNEPGHVACLFEIIEMLPEDLLRDSLLAKNPVEKCCQRLQVAFDEFDPAYRKLQNVLANFGRTVAHDLPGAFFRQHFAPPEGRKASSLWQRQFQLIQVYVNQLADELNGFACLHRARKKLKYQVFLRLERRVQERRFPVGREDLQRVVAQTAMDTGLSVAKVWRELLCGPRADRLVAQLYASAKAPVSKDPVVVATTQRLG